MPFEQHRTPPSLGIGPGHGCRVPLDLFHGKSGEPGHLPRMGGEHRPCVQQRPSLPLRKAREGVEPIRIHHHGLLRCKGQSQSRSHPRAPAHTRPQADTGGLFQPQLGPGEVQGIPIHTDPIDHSLRQHRERLLRGAWTNHLQRADPRPQTSGGRHHRRPIKPFAARQQQALSIVAFVAVRGPLAQHPGHPISIQYRFHLP